MECCLFRKNSHNCATLGCIRIMWRGRGDSGKLVYILFNACIRSSPPSTPRPERSLGNAFEFPSQLFRLATITLIGEEGKVLTMCHFPGFLKKYISPRFNQIIFSPESSPILTVASRNFDCIKIQAYKQKETRVFGDKFFLAKKMNILVNLQILCKISYIN